MKRMLQRQPQRRIHYQQQQQQQQKQHQKQLLMMLCFLFFIIGSVDANTNAATTTTTTTLTKTIATTTTTVLVPIRRRNRPITPHGNKLTKESTMTIIRPSSASSTLVLCSLIRGGGGGDGDGSSGGENNKQRRNQSPATTTPTTTTKKSLFHRHNQNAAAVTKALTTTKSSSSSSRSSTLKNKSKAKTSSSSPTSTKSSTAATTTTTTTTTPIPIETLIRILFLCYYGALGALLPYLPVYYHSLGHGGLIIGMLGAVKPLTTFLVAPLWGMISDQSRTAKFTVLYVGFLISHVGQLLVSMRTDVGFLVTMVFVTAVFNAPVKSLIDSIVMDHLPNKTQYGRMRLWGQLGFGLGSSGVGLLLSKSKSVAASASTATSSSDSIATSITALPPSTTTTTSTTMWDTLMEQHVPTILQPCMTVLHSLWMQITGYRLLFLAYAALSIPTWWALRVLDRLDREKEDQKDVTTTSTTIIQNNRLIRRIQEQLLPLLFGKNTSLSSKSSTSESTKLWKGIQLLCTNADAMLFFFLVFLVGTSSGLIENFAYVRMREVGGTGKEMGLSRLVSSAAGAPMFWFSGTLTETLGADRVLTLALLSYVTRFFLYAAMRNPYHGLPAEALRGVTFAAFWSTGTIYAHRISPPGMKTTMLMLLNAMYGGLGQSVGAIIGGKMQSMWGTVRTFVYAGIFDLCFVAFLTLYLYRNQDSSFRNPKPIQSILL